jgi:hypothetical protein
MINPQLQDTKSLEKSTFTQFFVGIDVSKANGSLLKLEK